MNRTRTAIIVALATIYGVLALPFSAFAQETDPTDTVADIRLSAMAVTLLVSLFIPILTGLITKASLSSYVKGLITLILNLVNAAVVGAVVVDGTAVFSEETLIAALVGMGVSVAMYLGIYKPATVTSTTSDEGIVGKLAPNTGIG